MKKQILILEQQSWWGGAQRVLDMILKSIDADFDPVVAFPERGPFSTALEERHIETLTIPLGKYPPGRKSYVDMMAFALRTLFCTVKIAWIIHRKRIAIVYINGPRCLPAGVTAACLMRRPSLFHLHLVLTRKPEILLAKHCARHVTEIVACSMAAADSLVRGDRRLIAKLDVFHNPTAERVRRVCLPVDYARRTDHITIGMVGRITKAKGHFLLFNALSRLSREVRSKIRLVIVGAPAGNCAKDLRYASGLKQHAKEIGLENILWTGYREDVARYYQSMDVLVQPSVAECGEALPLAVLEALETGVPVIASRTGGIPEVVRSEFNGLLYPTGDEAELARSLERFVEDPSLRNRLRAGAQAPLDDRFSLATFTRNIRRAVCLVCNDSNKPATPGYEEPFTCKSRRRSG